MSIRIKSLVFTILSRTRGKLKTKLPWSIIYCQLFTPLTRNCDGSAKYCSSYQFFCFSCWESNAFMKYLLCLSVANIQDRVAGVSVSAHFLTLIINRIFCIARRDQKYFVLQFYAPSTFSSVPIQCCSYTAVYTHILCLCHWFLQHWHICHFSSRRIMWSMCYVSVAQNTTNCCS